MDMVIYIQRKEMNRRPPHPHPASPNLKKTFEYAIYDLLKFDGDWGQVTTF